MRDVDCVLASNDINMMVQFGSVLYTSVANNNV